MALNQIKMRSLMKKLLVLPPFLVLVACNPVESIKEMQGKQSEFNEKSKKILNAEAAIGWNIHNGKLVNLQVTYPVGALGDRKISEVERIVTRLIHETYNDEPKRIVIAFEKLGATD